MKRLSNLGAKSWVLHDPPHSRLDCDPIKAGLIMNHCTIRLISPLEHQMYIEEETDQIHSNRRDLVPNLCVNWVSSVN